VLEVSCPIGALLAAAIVLLSRLKIVLRQVLLLAGLTTQSPCDTISSISDGILPNNSNASLHTASSALKPCSAASALENMPSDNMMLIILVVFSLKDTVILRTAMATSPSFTLKLDDRIIRAVFIDRSVITYDFISDEYVTKYKDKEIKVKHQYDIFDVLSEQYKYLCNVPASPIRKLTESLVKVHLNNVKIKVSAE
jgi:hypothetical protein